MKEKLWQFAIRRLVPSSIRTPGIADAVQFLETQTDRSRSSSTCDKSPVFILSAGWRSGSTLLQRLICSDASVLVWGEPFGDLIPVHHLAATISQIRVSDRYMLNAIDCFSEPLSGQWIANLNPGAKPIWGAHRAYFDALFAKPAMDRGFSRWGAKWVRLSAGHAFYLRWIYPDARFVFLVRHPLDAYRSYVTYLRDLYPAPKLKSVVRHPVTALSRRRRSHWYSVRPNFVMRGVCRFIAHWTYVAKSFLNHRERLGALLIRYEDLVTDGGTASALGSYLNIEGDHSVFASKLGASKDKPRTSLFARCLCRFLAGDLCEQLGYDISQETPRAPAVLQGNDGHSDISTTRDLTSKERYRL